MKHVKRFALFLLHLVCTVLVQVCLLRILLEEAATPYLRFLLPAVGFCVLDFAVACFLLKGHQTNRYGYMALQLWDLLLVSPMILLAVLGLISGEEGTGFGIAVILTELLLIVERSTSYVLFDPRRTR